MNTNSSETKTKTKLKEINREIDKVDELISKFNEEKSLLKIEKEINSSDI